MPSAAQISGYVERLASLPARPGAANLYAQSSGGGSRRAGNLRRYLECMAERDPRTLLVGEAPGHRGARATGVPFTSEAIMVDAGLSLPIPTGGPRCELDLGGRPPRAEATATVVWRALARLGDYLPLLWWAFPLHPHRVGNPASNRTPTLGEARRLLPLLDEFLSLFPCQRVIAVGRFADRALTELGVHAVRIRHPAHGGAVQFQIELDAALAGR